MSNNNKKVKLEYNLPRDTFMVLKLNEESGDYYSVGRIYTRRAILNVVPGLIQQGFEIDYDGIGDLELVSRSLSNGKSNGKRTRKVSDHGKEKIIVEETKTLSQIIEESREKYQ